MPQITAPDGSTQVIPGVYTDVRVRSSLPGPLPDFQIPIILASALQGTPYNFDDVKADSENALGAFIALATASAVSDYYGPWSDAHRAMVWAQRHGLPSAFVVSISPLTRASIILTSTGPVNELVLYPKSFGPIWNHTKVKLTATEVEFTYHKNYSMLVADAAATDTRIEVKHFAWVREGMTITIGDNQANANETHVVAKKIEVLGADGRTERYIELATPLTASKLQAQYALILEYDEQQKEAIPVSSLAAQEVLDEVNAVSQRMFIEEHASFSGAVLAPLVGTATAIKDIATHGAVVLGTAPAPTSTDVENFIADLNEGGWEDFALKNQLLPQAYYLASPDATSHLHMRDYAIAERNRGFPISVTTGCEWGDTDLTASNTTNPAWRAAALNSQDVALCAGGMDEEPAYLAMAGAVFGRRMEGGINHNLTNDTLLYSTVEVRWDEINGKELEALHKAAVITQRLGTFGAFRYLISQGLSTLQDNAGLIWNEVTKETWSLTQRDLMDFVDRVLKEDLNRTQVGADGVTEQSIAQVLVRRVEKSLFRRGYITEHSIVSITPNEGASGYDVEQNVKLPLITDYITVLSNIIIGD